MFERHSMLQCSPGQHRALQLEVGRQVVLRHAHQPPQLRLVRHSGLQAAADGEGGAEVAHAPLVERLQAEGSRFWMELN